MKPLPTGLLQACCIWSSAPLLLDSLKVLNIFVVRTHRNCVDLIYARHPVPLQHFFRQQHHYLSHAEMAFGHFRF